LIEPWEGNGCRNEALLDGAIKDVQKARADDREVLKGA